jgi:molecular chaperone HtpG
MVADKVTIDTLSYKEGAAAVHWACEGGIEFEMGDSTRPERGTTITLYINEGGEEFLEEYKLRGILEKYCGFVPVPIFVESVKDEPEPEVVDVDEDGEASDADEKEAKPKPINDTAPLWLKPPNECTDEEYKQFYRQVFMDFNEPLFWIHLNMDYPFRCKAYYISRNSNTSWNI